MCSFPSSYHHLNAALFAISCIQPLFFDIPISKTIASLPSYIFCLVSHSFYQYTGTAAIYLSWYKTDINFNEHQQIRHTLLLLSPFSPALSSSQLRPFYFISQFASFTSPLSTSPLKKFLEDFFTAIMVASFHSFTTIWQTFFFFFWGKTMIFFSFEGKLTMTAYDKLWPPLPALLSINMFPSSIFSASFTPFWTLFLEHYFTHLIIQTRCRPPMS